MSNKKLNEKLSFKIEPGGTLYLKNEVLRKLISFRQEKSRKKEAGGILLGKQFENNSNIMIDDITTPLKGDKRSRNQFYRSIGHHKKAVEYWKKSSGTCLYLGLWHSHPEMVPNPSPVDFNDWGNALKFGKYEGDSLLFIIVGVREIRCWQGKTNSKKNTKNNCNFKLLKTYDE